MTMIKTKDITAIKLIKFQVGIFLIELERQKRISINFFC